jgi:dTDP-4-amino-4,6-dideoxy-D-galactose acyltransferase
MSSTSWLSSREHVTHHLDERSPSLTQLAWDSERFGFPVARVDGAVRADGLSGVIDQAAGAGFALVYWFVPLGSNVPEELVVRHGGRLVDRKVRYTARVKDLPRLRMSRSMESYRAEVVDDEIRELALQGSAFSRFRVDSRLDARIVEILYDAWITRSVRREIADEVLVARTDGRAVGLVTLAENSGRGDIGLLAVDKSARGKGLGRALVHAAISWSRERHHETAQVVTQLDNRPACALYEACGYAIDLVEHVYHFWLADRLNDLKSGR